MEIIRASKSGRFEYRAEVLVREISERNQFIKNQIQYFLTSLNSHKSNPETSEAAVLPICNFKVDPFKIRHKIISFRIDF